MKQIVAEVVGAVLLLANCSALYVQAEDYETEENIIYVSQNSGSDNNDASADQPLRTIEAAVKKARDFSSEVTIMMDGGEYRLRDTLELTKEDSNITFSAATEEKPVIKGSIKLPWYSVKKVTDEEKLNRMYEDVSDEILYIDLAEYGITEDVIADASSVNGQYGFGNGSEFNSFYINETEQTVSQWPNYRNYAVFDSLVSDNSFTYTEDTPDRWSEASDWWIGAYIPYDYSYFKFGGVSIDSENNTLTYIENPVETYETYLYSKRWKAFNLLEEIDVPGEYYIDRADLKLYFYPTCDIEGATLELTVLNKPLISVTNGENITFDGIKFTHTNGCGIHLKDVKNVNVINCRFENIGYIAIEGVGTEYAATGRYYTDSEGNTQENWQKQMKNASFDVDISGCIFMNIGSSAISLSGAGNLDTLTSSGNVVENNVMSYISMKSLQPCIQLGGCGTTVRNNNMSMSPASGFLLSGNNHIIEYNELYNLFAEASDGAVIYQGRSDIFRGSIARYNYIHDIEVDNTVTYEGLKAGQCGIYWDDGQQGMTAEYNIIKNVPIDFNSNYAGDTLHRYNTSVDCVKHLNMHDNDLRSGWTVEYATSGLTIENVVELINGNELFYEAYPNLKDFVENATNPKRYSKIHENLAVGCGNLCIGWQDLLYASIEDNIMTDDYSVFVDPDNQDYRIKNDSEIAESMPNILNEDFDIDLIGLENDIELNSKNSGFERICPVDNKNVKYSDDGINFVWEPAMGANKYKLTVAKDSDFSDIVYENETMQTGVLVTGLSDNTKYYWKVEAENISRELGTVWQADNGSGIFKVSDYAEDYSVENFTAEFNYSGKTVNINCDITDNLEKQETINALIGIYEDSKLVSVKKAECDFSENKNISINETTGFNSVPNNVKLFLWKNEMTPVIFSKNADMKVTALEEITDKNVEFSEDSDVVYGYCAELSARVVSGEDEETRENFRWLAVDKAREDIIEGITISRIDENSVSISVDKTVPNGEYDIVAFSDGIVKGKTINVITDFSDSELPEKPENMIKNPNSVNSFNGKNDAEVDIEYPADYSYLTYLAKTDNYQCPYWGVINGYIDSTKLNSTFKAETTYVVSANVRNEAPDISENPLFGVRIVNAYLQPKEITSTEWTRVKGVVKPTANGESICLGFDTREVPLTKGAKLTLNVKGNDTMYVAEEKAYEINLESDSTVMKTGYGIIISAELYNQIGICGNLKQKFKWAAMDSSRNKFIDAIEIVPINGDSSKVLIMADEKIDLGKYTIVAMSEGITKGIVIEIDDGKDKPVNMIAEPNTVNSFNGTNDGNVKILYNDDGYTTITYQTVTDGYSNTYWGVISGYIDSSKLNGSFTAGKNYVVSANVKNDATDVLKNPKFGVKLGDSIISHEITSSDYVNVKDVITAVSDGNTICLGFDSRSPLKVGAKLTMTVVGDDTMYIAEEVAYDITNTVTSNSEIYLPGDSIELKAEVINQIGITGNLGQSFTWYALNGDKTEITDDITVTAGENGSAEAKISEDIAPGRYYIAAESNNYDGFVKFAEIEIYSLEDYAPKVKPANMITKPNSVNSFNGTNDGNVKISYNSDYTDITYEVATDGYSSTHWGVINGYITNSADTTKLNGSFTAGKSYVVSANVKNEATNVWANPKFGVKLGGSIISHEITSSDYVNVKDVITAVSDGSAVCLGFDSRSPLKVGAKLTMTVVGDDTMYIAEEVVYDMTTEIVSSKTNANGDWVLTVKSEITNQIGITGNLDQSVTWHAVNKDRTAFVDGVEITEGEEGTATVTVPASLADEGLNIMAFSDSYDARMAAYVGTLEVEVTALDTTNGTATVKFVNDSGKTCEGVIYVANYSGNTLVSVVSENYSVASGEDAKTVNFTPVEGAVTKVFVWDSAMKPVLK